MNSLKLVKNMKNVSKWTVTDIEDKANTSDNTGFTEHEMGSSVVIPMNSVSNQNGIIPENRGKMTIQRKRRLKRECSLGFKQSELQSVDGNEVNDVSELMEIDEDPIPSWHDESDEKNEIFLGDENRNENISELEDWKDEYYEKENEMIEAEKKIPVEKKIASENSVGASDDDEDIEDIMNKLQNSDSESDVSSSNSQDDFTILKESCKYLKYHVWLKEELFQSYRMYFMKNDHRCILHLPRTKKFHFQGKLQITLLYGGIRVFGYKLNSFDWMNQTLELYTPRRSMQLCIISEGAVVPSTTNTILEMLLTKYELTDFSKEQLIKYFDVFDSLILIDRLFDKHSLILNHYCDDDLFLEKEITLKGSCEEKKLGCFLNKLKVYAKRGFTKGSLWSKIKPRKCTIVCGGKGVGKSTLFKYLINLKLNHTIAVLCIDLDPGQTEFTMPGCVSAVVRNKPLLGPNFTNITTPVKMAYVGYVNVASDPVKYMNAVNYVVQSCREHPFLSQLPWFVNTMGFNKGIGLDIMINIIRLIQPDKVVQISSSDKTRNYRLRLTPELVQHHRVLSLVPVKSAKLMYELHTIRSCSKTNGIRFQGDYTPAQLREFMTISYFADVISIPYCSLNAVQPRWINFSKVYIAVNDVVQPNNILKAINGNLVGLCDIEGVECRVKSVAVTDSNNCFLKLAIQPEIAPCFGCGFVRGIDVKEEKIYIITPLSSEDLEKVNCLCLGNISVPSSFYMKQKYINAPPVYVDVRGVRNIKSIKYQFKYYPQTPCHKPE